MKYLDRYNSHSALELIKINEPDDYCPDLIVVVPAYNEEIGDIVSCIESLENQTDSEISFLFLILINYKTTDDHRIQLKSSECYNSLLSMPTFARKGKNRYRAFLLELQGKNQGVGLARKILMDAAFRFYYRKNVNGIIVNLDADTTVSNNYISHIHNYFNHQQHIEAAGIAFEHPVTHSDSSESEYAAALYELHLRYFVNMQRLLHLPYAYQTIGSAMAVRAWSYAKEGGMNKRQAGEDFYFLHKFSNNGTLGEINSCTVIPATRISDRVPFGTGKAIGDALMQKDNIRRSYHPEHFAILKAWLDAISTGGAAPGIQDPHLNRFLESMNCQQKLEEIKENTSDKAAFMKRFYQWFNPFMLMKYLHYMRDNLYSDIEIGYCIRHLFVRLQLQDSGDPIENLIKLRSFDRNNSTY